MVYCKVLFFIIVVLHLEPKIMKNVSEKVECIKVQGFQPQVHDSYFVEHSLATAFGVLKMPGN